MVDDDDKGKEWQRKVAVRCTDTTARRREDTHPMHNSVDAERGNPDGVWSQG